MLGESVTAHTMGKVFRGLRNAGLNIPDARQAIGEMQSQGILFRERVETPEEPHVSMDHTEEWNTEAIRNLNAINDAQESYSEQAAKRAASELSVWDMEAIRAALLRVASDETVQDVDISMSLYKLAAKLNGFIWEGTPLVKAPF